jgi:hypothetical protein
MREIKSNVRILFFVMFVLVCVLLLMRGVFESTIFFFLSRFNFIDKKKSDMVVIRFKLIKPTIVLWVLCGHTYVPAVHN